jgi:hypothetical protein
VIHVKNDSRCEYDTFRSMYVIAHRNRVLIAISSRVAMIVCMRHRDGVSESGGLSSGGSRGGVSVGPRENDRPSFQSVRLPPHHFSLVFELKRKTHLSIAHKIVR